MPYESRKNDKVNKVGQSNNGSNTSLPSRQEIDRKNRERSSSKAIKDTTPKSSAFDKASSLMNANRDLKAKLGKNLINPGSKVLDDIPGVKRGAKILDDNSSVNTIDKKLTKNNLFSNKNVNQGESNSNSPSSDDKINENNGANDEGNANNNKQANKISSRSSKAKQSDNDNSSNIAGLGPFSKKKEKESVEDDSENKQSFTSPFKLSGFFSKTLLIKVVIILAPFLILLIAIIAILGSVLGNIGNFVDALGAMMAAGEETGDIEFSTADVEAANFYERINNIKLSYQASGRNVDVLKIAAVYKIFFQDELKLSYEEMTDEKIREVADCMFSGNSYNEDIFGQNLLNYLIPKYFPTSSDNEREKIVSDIFDYIELYYDFIGKESTVCASIGSCVYDIKGFYISGKGNITKNLNVSNLNVRLMQSGYADGHDYGGTWGQPLEGEELVPFEKYILGVAYQEIGPDKSNEAIKAQMVAARSYILARPFDMGGWRKLEKEGNSWVIQVAASTQDQVYCDPDQGCSSPIDGQWGEVYSGLNHGRQIKPPMAQNHKMRQLAAETMGEVLVNNQGNIIYTGFGSGIQNRMESLARSGLNYKQILLEIYGSLGASDIQKNSCNDGSSSCGGSVSVGPFAGWKQYSGTWTGVQLGSSNETIRSAGCLVTSVAMLIAKSGVSTNISDFNPGTFVEYLNTHGGFVGPNFVWASTSKVAPTFNFQGKIDVSGKSKNDKLNTLKGLLQRNAYVVAEVKGSTGQHWVAIDGIDNDKILMMDPGSQSTDMWSQYPWNNTSQFAYFMVG